MSRLKYVIRLDIVPIHQLRYQGLLRGALLYSSVVAALLMQSIGLAQSQSIGFVQFEAPALRVKEPLASVQEGAKFVDNATAFGWAILKANSLELEHRIDFAVITVDFGVFKFDPPLAALELARLARGLTVNRIYILTGPCLRTPEMRRHFAEFVSDLQKALPLHRVSDLTGHTEPLGEFRLVGLDVAALSSGDSQELSRIGKDVAAGRPTLLFASVEKTPGKGTLIPESLWRFPEWVKAANQPNVSGIFLSVLGPVPQAGASFPSPGNKLPVSMIRVAPRLDTEAVGPGRGLLFVRAARDGHVDAAPIWMPSPEEPIDRQNSMFEAGLKERNGEYADAYKLYNDAIQSKDAYVRAQADAGLRRTNAALQGWWERWKSEFPPARWSSHHWLEMVILASLLLAFVSYRWMDGTTVKMASKLGDDSPAALFMMEFIDSVNAIPTIWRGVPLGAGGNLYPKVALSTDAANEIAKQLEGLKVPGVDVQAILKWLQFLSVYFSWRLEFSVYGTAAQTVVYARRCFMSYTSEVWLQPSSTTGPFSAARVARALASDVIWSGVRLK